MTKSITEVKEAITEKLMSESTNQPDHNSIDSINPIIQSAISRNPITKLIFFAIRIYIGNECVLFTRDEFLKRYSEMAMRYYGYEYDIDDTIDTMSLLSTDHGMHEWISAIKWSVNDIYNTSNKDGDKSDKDNKDDKDNNKRNMEICLDFHSIESQLLFLKQLTFIDPSLLYTNSIFLLRYYSGTKTEMMWFDMLHDAECRCVQN